MQKNNVVDVLEWSNAKNGVMLHNHSLLHRTATTSHMG